MYQNGSGHPSLSSLTSAHSTLNMVPPTSTSTSPYSHESLASSFMHSGSTPVYVPTNRPSLHSSHMSAYGVGNGGTQQNPSSLSGTPTGSSMWQTDNLGMAYSAQTTPTRFGFSPPQSGQIMSSDSSAVAAAAYAGTSLPRTPTALNPYSPYMRADFNAWSSFSNMALQGFKQTVDHDSLLSSTATHKAMPFPISLTSLNIGDVYGMQWMAMSRDEKRKNSSERKQTSLPIRNNSRAGHPTNNSRCLLITLRLQPFELPYAFVFVEVQADDPLTSDHDSYQGPIKKKSV
ncbi:hypothetical protein BgiMline_035304 [Biomphalaria glabrata]